MSIPLHYGGIDRLYGDISIESADKVLDLIDEYIDLKESIIHKELNKENTNYEIDETHNKFVKKNKEKNVTS